MDFWKWFRIIGTILILLLVGMFYFLGGGSDVESDGERSTVLGHESAPSQPSQFDSSDEKEREMMKKIKIN